MASHISILVTGSRSLANPAIVTDALDEVLSQYTFEQLTLHVGDCPTGADKFAREWWTARQSPGGYETDDFHGLVCTCRNGSESMLVYRAGWSTEGKSAGPKRNSRMVDAYAASPATAALALPSHDSLGTWDCMRKLVRAKLTFRCVSC